MGASELAASVLQDLVGARNARASAAAEAIFSADVELAAAAGRIAGGAHRVVGEATEEVIAVVDARRVDGCAAVGRGREPFRAARAVALSSAAAASAHARGDASGARSAVAVDAADPAGNAANAERVGAAAVHVRFGAVGDAVTAGDAGSVQAVLIDAVGVQRAPGAVRATRALRITTAAVDSSLGAVARVVVAREVHACAVVAFPAGAVAVGVAIVAQGAAPTALIGTAAIDVRFGAVLVSVEAGNTDGAFAVTAGAVPVDVAVVAVFAAVAGRVIAPAVDVGLVAAQASVRAGRKLAGAFAHVGLALRVVRASGTHRTQPAARDAPAVDGGLVTVLHVVIARGWLATGVDAGTAPRGVAHLAVAIRRFDADAAIGAAVLADPAAIRPGLVLVLDVVVAVGRAALPVLAADVAVAVGVDFAGRSRGTARTFAAAAILEHLIAALDPVLARIVGAHARSTRAKQLRAAIGVDLTRVAAFAAGLAAAAAIDVRLVLIEHGVVARRRGALV